MTDTMVRYQEFRLPDVGEGLQDAEIARWHVGVGDTVTDGQVVCEIETAKAMVELPVPFAGVVRELRFPEGTTVDVGEVIITVAPPGADLAPAAVAAPAAAVTQAPAEPARQPVLVGYGAAAAPTSRRPRRQAPPPSAAPAVPAVPVRGAERPMAKPPVRKLARDLGVDLGRVRPSGRHGDITREDVRTAAAEAVPVPVPVPAQAQAQAQARAHETRIPASAVRKATARAMTESAFGAPHVTEFVTVDVTRTMKLVERLRKDPEFAGVRVSPLLLAVRALLFAVRRHPEINASWDEERQEIVLKHRVNLGIAAATPRGLLVPNIKDAQSLSLPRLAAALDGLVTTAREGRTTPADLGGGTLTVTNIGVFGIDTGTPILNPGEAAILALGAIGPRPWVHRGEVVPRQVTTLALSFDHRLVDGELGSRVLADVAAVLHDPRRLATHG
ncbi:dihydrolipoamide acetyltransferase family protein [Streptomyces sp. G1]|uniref:dihydrolipoamide acetyltransferase family protein n=1 Tax=Streptomyces sp. G1 TaxID=361572 RepID=UPI00202F0C3B|nr:dihydrolipoamide acetyltransferase family protein [Streptomyces sp. G1]MCM1965074.1 2-oxo acid dehydrogenase subunit E2 [Streptomyces sp. G1]